MGNIQRQISTKVDLEKGTLTYAVMKQAQDVGKWSESRVPMCPQLAYSLGGRERGENLVESHTNVIIYKHM